MSGIKFLFFIGFLSLCDAFWWGRENRETAPVQISSPSTIPPPPLRQYPISYIRAFAYHPVAFPQPLAPITTYHVRNQQSPSRSFGGSQVFAQQQPPNVQISQDFVTPSTTPSTTTTTTTTTTPAPTTTTTTTQAPSFSGSQPISQAFSRLDYSPFSRSDYGQTVQRQLPQQQSTNYGGYPYYYNQQYHYRYDDGSSNQFSGRLYNGEQQQPQYQQYTVDPVTYQFIPTSITPIQPQNSIKFVPCMCPVSVQVSPNLAEKRNQDEIPIVAPTTETSTSSTPAPVPSTQFEESEEEAK